MKKFDTLLTDIDGTIIDTKIFVSSAFKHSIKKHTGITVSDEQMNSVFGKPALDILRKFTGLINVELLYNTVNEFQAASLHLVAPFPGSIETLEKLRMEGVKIAGITNRTLNTKSVVEAAGVHHLFDIIVAGDDVKNFKPHPEGLYKALKHLGTPLSRAVMMGDVADDILAGKQAGLKTIGVTYGMLGDRIREHDPDFVIGDITEVLGIIL